MKKLKLNRFDLHEIIKAKVASQLIANLQSPKVEQRVETSNRKRKRPSEEVQRIPEVTVPEPSTTESPSLFDLQR